MKKNMNKSIIVAFLFTTLIATLSSAAPPPQAETSPTPLHSLMELDLSEEQLTIAEKKVDETEQIRHKLRREYRDLKENLEAAEQAEVKDQTQIRELLRQQVENREQMRQERDRFHTEMEKHLTEKQVTQWHEIRGKRQGWCQQKWMQCSDCSCQKK